MNEADRRELCLVLEEPSNNSAALSYQGFPAIVDVRTGCPWTHRLSGVTCYVTFHTAFRRYHTMSIHDNICPSDLQQRRSVSSARPGLRRTPPFVALALANVGLDSNSDGPLKPVPSNTVELASGFWRHPLVRKITSPFARLAMLVSLSAAISAAMSAGSSGRVVANDAATRPNIVFVLADDLGWSEIGCCGNDFNETPHLDRLASQGMRFTQAYAAAPVCSP